MFKRIKTTNVILVLILSAGCFLRVLGCDFGTPFMFHPDEGFEIHRALQLGSGSFDFERTGKGVYFYFLFIEYSIYFIFAYLTGAVSGAKDFAVEFISDPSVFLLLGRLTTALIATATIYLVYRIGSINNQPITGLIAAAILASNPMHVEHSHYVTVDILLTFFCVLFFVKASRLNKDSGIASYSILGAIIGFAAATKMPGLILVLPFIFIHQHINRSTLVAVITNLFDKRLLISGLVFLLVFSILNPGAVLNFDIYLAKIADILLGSEFTDISQTNQNKLNPMATISNEVDNGADTDSGNNFFLYYLNVLQTTVSLPILIISVLGVLTSLIKRQPIFIFMSSFAIIFYLVLGSTAVEYLVYPRYVLPMLPFISLVAGLFIYTGIDWFLSKTNLSRSNYGSILVISLSTIFVIFIPTRESVATAVEFTQTDTRQLAHEWFIKSEKQGVTVYIEGSTARANNHTVPLRMEKSQLTEVINSFKSNNEKGKAFYFTLERDYVESERFHLVFYKYLTIPTEVLNNNAQPGYLVIRPKALRTRAGPEIVNAFIDQLNKADHISLTVSFLPEKGHLKGPDILIYEIKTPMSISATPKT